MGGSGPAGPSGPTAADATFADFNAEPLDANFDVTLERKLRAPYSTRVAAVLRQRSRYSCSRRSVVPSAS